MGERRFKQASERQRQAELLAAELRRRAEVMTSHLTRAGVLLAQAAPAAATQLLQDLDEEVGRHPELGPALRPVRAAVAAELAAAKGGERPDG